MSRYMSRRHSSLVPYVPGEQPKERKFIKLNTNESPFPPPEPVLKAVAEAAAGLQLYSDPTCCRIAERLAATYGVSPDMVIVSNGSDDVLNYAFCAFCDEDNPALFADITYGFYPVFANLNNIPYTEIPLREDFTIDINDYIGRKGTVFIANPNAPTGIQLPVSEIERLVSADPGRIVVVDEAYVDFGGDTCLGLVDRYPNILITRTYSKSRSMAGARLGFAIGNREIVGDLQTIRNSTNPYNINSMTMAAGIASLDCEDYTRACCEEICRVRAYTGERLVSMGFEVLDSRTNFLFASNPRIDGGDYYLKLREKGILVRHFSLPRISRFNRITVGTQEQMDALLAATEEILKEI